MHCYIEKIDYCPFIDLTKEVKYPHIWRELSVFQCYGIGRLTKVIGQNSLMERVASSHDRCLINFLSLVYALLLPVDENISLLHCGVSNCFQTFWKSYMNVQSLLRQTTRITEWISSQGNRWESCSVCLFWKRTLSLRLLVSKETFY